MNVSVKQVKELRDRTNISVGDCKRALEEAGGDMDKALLILKTSSAKAAEKRAAREAREGRIALREENGRATLVSLRCETDFVAKSEDFGGVLSALLDMAHNDGVEKMRAGAEEMIASAVQRTGEKIILGEAGEVRGEILGTYSHGGRGAAIVSLEGGTRELAKDIAMQAVAMRPEYIREEDIDQETKKKVEELLSEEVEKSGKAEAIKTKMLAGKIDAYFREKILLHQPFIKNPEETVNDLLKKNGARIKEVFLLYI